MTPRPLLLLEGAAVVIASLLCYHKIDGSWLLFVLLFFVPDISMLGYLINVGIGAIAYNAVHSYAIPLLVAACALLAGHPAILALAVIWIAHIGFDRMLGFGLKYPTRFKDTHLNPRRHALGPGSIFLSEDEPERNG